jgi:hypothetical protein
VEPDATRAQAVAEAELDAAEAERQAEARHLLLARLRRPSEEANERIAMAKATQHAAATALLSAEHADALAARDRAVEALAGPLARPAAVELAACQLGHALKGTAPASLRQMLSSERLALSSACVIALDWPSWLRRDSEVGDGADALLALAGSPAATTP